MKPLAYWANETIFRDGFGNPLGYLPGSPAGNTIGMWYQHKVAMFSGIDF
jgi:hypothetical protein